MFDINFDIGTIFTSLMKGIFSIIVIFAKMLIPVFIVIFIIIFLIIFNYINYRYLKGFRPKLFKLPYYFTYENKRYVILLPRPQNTKKTSFWKNIFYLFPKQLAYDVLNTDPNAFAEFGIHIVTGEQGAGKTMTVVYLLQEWKKKYPLMKTYTNMCYKYEDGELVSWKDLLLHNNGIYGVVNVIDEIKTWWSNRDSKDVPPEILGEICQQRKQKKATIGTVQVFSELAKPFRSQTHFVYVPHTFWGCLTIVFKSKAKYYDAENDKFKKYCGFFIFAHTKKLRNAYDTFKKIEKYKEVEFEGSQYFDYNGQAPLVEVSIDKK